MSHLSWNVGGVLVEQIEHGLREMEKASGGTFGLISLQELPRQNVGWATHQIGPWQVVSHRDLLAWRGAAVGFRPDQWTVMRKKQSSRGVWLRLRRICDGVELWCGSVYFSQGATREVHAAEVHDYLGALPATNLPVCVGGDANSLIRWFGVEGGVPQATSPESKGEYMLGAFMSSGLAAVSPERGQWNTPTSRPRKEDAQGRQIDFLAVKHVSSTGTRIHENSYMLVGSDHEALSHDLRTRVGKTERSAKKDHRPRVVVRDVAVDGDLNQQKLQQLAVACTKPKPGRAYVDPPQLKIFFQVARANRRPEEWKRALRGRAEARREWQTEQIRAATSGDWGAYRETTKKGAVGWEAHFACSQEEGVDPHQLLHDHLQKVY